MEFLFELIFELLLDGSTEAVSSRRVPLPLRIMAGILLVAVYGGLIVCITWAAIAQKAWLLLLVSLLLLAVGVGFAWKCYKKIRSGQ